MIYGETVLCASVHIYVCMCVRCMLLSLCWHMPLMWQYESCANVYCVGKIHCKNTTTTIYIHSFTIERLFPSLLSVVCYCEWTKARNNFPFSISEYFITHSLFFSIMWPMFINIQLKLRLLILLPNFNFIIKWIFGRMHIVYIFLLDLTEMNGIEIRQQDHLLGINRTISINSKHFSYMDCNENSLFKKLKWIKSEN